MSWRSSLLLLCSVTAFGQDAVTSLTSFWEMDVNDSDRIAWDYKGTAHGIYFGTNFNAATSMFGSGWYRGAGTQVPYNSGGVTVPGSTIATGSGSFAYCIWVRPSSTASDVYLGQWGSDTAKRSWTLSFNAIPGRPRLGYQMTDTTTGLVLPSSPTVSAGALTMVCMHYNSSTGQLGVSGNGQAWTLGTPAAPFQPPPAGNSCSHPASIYDPFYPCTLDFDHSHNQFFPTGEPIIGRTMFWNGYIPTDAELSDIYNGGAGRDQTYFGLNFTAPTRPLTVTLADSVFADDANLTGEQGLYYLRPYPLKTWEPSLASSNGDYAWVRSTDHSTGAGGIWLGYSASPAILPSSWTQIITDTWLSSADPSNNWQQVETPHLEWDPDTNLFHLYFHAVLLGSSNPFVQKTHVATSPDLSTWTWGGVALETQITGCPSPTYPGGPFCYNHTGYAYIKRNGTGDWVAQSLLTSSEPSGTDGFIRLGTWTSTDGISFTFNQETEVMAPKMPYRNNQNQRVGRTLSGETSSLVFSANYFGTKYTQLEFDNPPWPLFFHPGDNSPTGDFLQDVRIYEEDCVVYAYAKWSYQEPSTTRLYTGSLDGCSPIVTPGLHLSDRRPIGAMFIADGSKTSTNPRGYNVGGSPDFLGAGFATAKAALLTKIGTLLDNADAYSPRPQAVMIWDLEGQEMQHSFTYVGAPHLLSALSPEMDSMADDIMALIRSRGYEPGLTLRPHRIRYGSGRPTDGCWSQGSTDGGAYIDTSASYPNRGYRCGPGTATFPSGSTVQTSGTFVVNYQSGSVVRFVSTGTLPSPLVSGTDYYMCSWNNGAQTFTVATDSGCSSVISSYTGGSGTHTFMSWRGPSDLAVQELIGGLSNAYDFIKTKIDYARSRWGIKYFYVDSSYYGSIDGAQSATVLPNTDFWDLLNEDYPDTVFMPENSSSSEFTAKYLSFNNGSYKRSSTNLVIPHIQSTSPGYTDWRSEIQAEIADGVPYMVTLNTAATGGNPNDLYRQDLLANAATLGSLVMTDSGAGKTRVFRSRPGTTYAYPVAMRVYFASSSAGLPASTTYCEKKASVACYLNGSLQGSATMDLSTLTYYSARYYDYDGNVVSDPKTHGILR